MTNVLLMESFEGVSTIAQLAGAAAFSATTRWQSGDTPSNEWSLNAGDVVKSGTNVSYLGQSISSKTTIVFGFKFVPATIAGTANIFGAGGGLPSDALSLRTVGSELKLFNSSVERSATSGLGLVAGTRYAIELKLVFSSGSSWTTTLKVNGVAVIGPSVLNFGISSINAYLLGGNGVTSGRANDRWDDFYIDGTDFLAGGGAWSIQVIRPDGAGAHTDWVPDSGSNYARVNEQSVDDTSYVQGTNDNDEDTYTYANPTHVAGHSVRAVQVYSRAAYLAGAKKLAHIIRDGGGTEGQGADKTLTSSLAAQNTAFNKQADGTTDWGSFSDLDSYQFGRKQRA